MWEAIVLPFYAFLLYFINVASDLNDDSVDLRVPPQHEFLFEKQKFLKNKSERKTFVKLIIKPHTFKIKSKAKRVGDKARFMCTGCAKKEINKYVSAQATLISRDDDGKEKYLLTHWPKDEDHGCTASSVNHLKVKFMSAIYAQVEANPEKSIGTIYNEERGKIIEIHKLNDIEKDKLFALLPSQRNVQANLNLYKCESCLR